MRVPKPTLRRFKGLIKIRGDHVLDANEASVGVWGVVEEALAYFIVEVGAVVVCFDFAAGVVGVDVECVEMGADALQGCEVLNGSELTIGLDTKSDTHLSYRCASREDLVLGGQRLPWDIAEDLLGGHLAYLCDVRVSVVKYRRLQSRYMSEMAPPTFCNLYVIDLLLCILFVLRGRPGHQPRTFYSGSTVAINLDLVGIRNVTRAV